MRNDSFLNHGNAAGFVELSDEKIEKATQGLTDGNQTNFMDSAAVSAL